MCDRVFAFCGVCAIIPRILRVSGGVWASGLFAFVRSYSQGLDHDKHAAAVRGVHVAWPPSSMVGLKTSGEEEGDARRVDLVEQVSDGEIISMMTDGSPLNHFLNTQMRKHRKFTFCSLILSIAPSLSLSVYHDLGFLFSSVFLGVCRFWRCIKSFYHSEDSSSLSLYM